MKIILFISLILLIASCNKKNTVSNPGYEEAKLSGGLKDTITAPVLFVKIDEINGDLNNDDILEKVIVYNTKNETDFGTEREIHIYKKENDKWELWHKSIGAVLPSKHGGTMGDPFESVSIENNCIVIYHSGGSSQKWSYAHKYQKQQESWRLIEATSTFGAPCDYFEHATYNLVTGHIQYKKEMELCDEKTDSLTTKTTNAEFIKKPNTLPEMDGFYPGSNQILSPDSKTSVYY